MKSAVFWHEGHQENSSQLLQPIWNWNFYQWCILRKDEDLQNFQVELVWAGFCHFTRQSVNYKIIPIFWDLQVVLTQDLDQRYLIKTLLNVIIFIWSLNQCVLRDCSVQYTLVIKMNTKWFQSFVYDKTLLLFYRN